MPKLSVEATDAALQNAVAVERYKSTTIKMVDPFLRDIERYIRSQLQFSDLTTYQRDRLEKLLKRVRHYSGDKLRSFTDDLIKELKVFAGSQAQWEAEVFRSTMAAVPDVPTATQIAAAVTSRPMSVRGLSGSPLMEPYLKAYTPGIVAAIDGAIRQGVVEGQTNSQIIRRMRGSPGSNYRDGVLGGTALNQARTIVRTGVQHVSSVARMAVAEANRDIVPGYQWLATLDHRTCPTCAGLDGQVFKWGDGPMPPIHPNCRCTTVFVTDSRYDALEADGTRASTFGPVGQKETYYSWLENQNAAFQDFALGPKWGALFRRGGLSAEKFSELRLDRNFRPITLERFYELRPDVFRRANVDPP